MFDLFDQASVKAKIHLTHIMNLDYFNNSFLFLQAVSAEGQNLGCTMSDLNVRIQIYIHFLFVDSIKVATRLK